MLEILFLLLPIAAGYGWYMGRRSLRQHHLSHRKRLSRDYFTGLNYLLSNESDKAVDLFISLLDVDDETIDTHMSLGALFRTRGEVDRSIRIHQNLIARPSLTPEQRDAAMMELGKDYMAAGFYDRAEEIFLAMVKEAEHSEEAESQLIAIYQITKEWQKAIDISKRLNKKAQQALNSTIAHFYCQLAEETTEVSHKYKLLSKALKQDEFCGRAQLTLARLYLDESRFDAASGALKALADADPLLFTEGIQIAREVYAAMGDNDGYRELLAHTLASGGGASLVVALAEEMVSLGQLKMAEQLLLENLYRQPTMKGFSELMKLHIRQAEEGQAKESLSLLEQLVEQQIKLRPAYRCKSCGFPAHALYWHCPSCKSWGTIARIRGLDGE